ncbi:hypothetical protein [Rhodopirellula sallentina]|uniref:ATP-binding protein n=1 Tax=Rhodopirellula sallentina SM41 TaxID=1263870 RepID=M5U8T3_9BACT|nr:hypothetical protein [Rhodopirellula sallentina]EMI57684.1 ATP-binding protein [Rhodopirellula sallentina SM41]
MQSQTITCPQGHQLRASKRVFGKTLPCPVCKQLLTVPLFPPPPETDPVAADASAPEEKKDSLSDTGVMRILGDYVARDEEHARDKSVDEKARTVRSCPVCDSSLSEAVTICKNCKCYVGPTPDFFKQFAR